ncbi:uncharacterized protein LOC123312332 [Coccinella septempunctata]|uniref:uncharacterized protein LOC123312332 n=1 Tax=Coccinella septempunctata TaxID=41139 RepID=UPI001D074CD7|nr:uncharacterized protein LOC123312332 [Coccinella septempunctata]
MERNTFGESCSVENDQSSHISLTAKQGFMDITTPLEISAIEVESWSDLEEKILNIFNNKVRNEDKQLFVLYQNKLFSTTPSSSSNSLYEESEEDDNMYEEIVQTFNLATQQEAEVVMLPDQKTWKRMWKYLKKVLKIRKRNRNGCS